ncbi:MAG: translation initiation factor IF-2 [Planctomycetota bacterium]
MPARIYALAKELKLDSKDLVEIVKKVGITGKGSALASLSDDETQKIRDHLSGGAEPAQPKTKVVPRATSPSQPVGAVRDSVTPSAKKPRAINVGRSKPSSPGVAAPAAKAPAQAPPASKPPATATPAAEASPAAEAQWAADDKVDTATLPEPAQQPATASGAVAEAKSESSADTSSTDSKAAAANADSSAAGAGSTAAGGDSATAAQPGSQAGSEDADNDGSPDRVSRIKKGGLASRIASRMAARRPSPMGDGAPGGAVRSDTTRGGGRKVRSLDSGSRGGGDAKKGGDRPKRAAPRINVKMASLPEVEKPKPAGPVAGEKAQKPDVKLSPDAIAGARQGMRAPLDQIVREENEKKQRGQAKRGAGGLSGFTGADRGKKEKEEEKPRRKGIAGMAGARVDRGRNRNRNIQLDRSGMPMERRRPTRSNRRKGVSTAAPRKEAVSLELPATVRSFSEAAGVPVGQVLGTVMKMGIPGVNINSQLDFEAAELIAAELDLEIQLKETETLEDAVISGLEEFEDDPDSLVPRAPIVTFLGHVDHGKTSLLDHLIGINVVSGEAGGITQHIRAYEVEKDGRKVTFVDTPGHEAFTEMRARGANVTDIAVLVVAADDGIMPQTEEAISHAKAAEVPIVVALNKIDLEGVDANRVLTQLTEHQLTPSEWGGDVEVVRTSAIKGTGMDELLETLLTIAELNEYQANPDRSAMGVCLESEQQGDRGVEAKLVVQTGTLKVTDIVVCGASHGRIRAMNDTLTGQPITQAGPSTPVSVLGFDKPPGAGDRFHVLDDIAKAREIAATRQDAASQESLSGVTTKVSFENFQQMLQEGQLGLQEERVKLNLIVRADVKGSLEAIDKELSKFDHPEVEVRVLQRSVGGVTLADVTLASASDAVICAFNVIPDEQARALADERDVEIRRYDVIYKLTDEIKALIEGRLKPEERIVELGRAVVKQVFNISKAGTIAGCYVASGSIQRGCRIRVNRDGRTIGDYGLDSLKRIKEDVREVPRGMECGIKLAGFNDVKQDDVLEAYKVEEVARTLD